MNLFRLVSACAALSFVVMSVSAAEIDGVWTWVQRTQGNDTVEPRATLKREGSKITGKIKTRDREQEITEGTISEEGEIHLKVVRDRGDFKFISEYTGKLEGKKIRGRQKSNFNGNITDREWVAEPYKEPVGPEGNWRWVVKRPDGHTMDYTARFQVAEDGSVTGYVAGPSGQRLPISNGKYAKDVVTFDVVRERDGRKFISTYSAKVEKNEMVGKIDNDATGKPLSYDWRTKRVER